VFDREVALVLEQKYAKSAFGNFNFGSDLRQFWVEPQPVAAIG
jgi:hypothetical protein